MWAIESVCIWWEPEGWWKTDRTVKRLDAGKIKTLGFSAGGKSQSFIFCKAIVPVHPQNDCRRPQQKDSFVGNLHRDAPWKERNPGPAAAKFPLL